MPRDNDAVVAHVIADKYEVRGVLGEGGTGIVYDALRIEDGTPVALKVMHPRLVGDRQIRGRFKREAAILRRLEGPNIGALVDFGEVYADDPAHAVLYLALPKIDGPSLEVHARKEGLLPVDRVLDLMIEVCAALETAHRQGIIHRDLKPANVILKDGKTVVVVDFGLSKIVTGSGVGTTNLTTHNMLFGTPEYMSPEQARGDDLDARCDVYAAGVMLYELLTGTPPFTGETPLNVLTAHLTSDLEPPSKRAPPGRITAALEAVTLHALARDREERYRSAAAFGKAIRRARLKPDDIASLRPAFALAESGMDALGMTIPALTAPVHHRTPTPRAIVNLPPRPDALGAPTSLDSPMSRSNPPARAPTLPPARAADVGSSRMWIVLWVVAAVASIGAGVYFALR